MKAQTTLSPGEYSPPAKVVLQRLKTYGMLLADNGGEWFISGALHEQWDEEDLQSLKHVRGGDLECVEAGPLSWE